MKTVSELLKEARVDAPGAQPAAAPTTVARLATQKPASEAQPATPTPEPHSTAKPAPEIPQATEPDPKTLASLQKNPVEGEDLSALFTQWQIGKVTIKNRIVMTSMGGTNLLGWMEKNHFDEMGAHFIQTVAENNVGLVLPGCQPVLNPMFGQWLYKNKKMYRDLAKWLVDLGGRLRFRR